jgi:hypothetical protein
VNGTAYSNLNDVRAEMLANVTRAIDDIIKLAEESMEERFGEKPSPPGQTGQRPASDAK